MIKQLQAELRKLKKQLRHLRFHRPAPPGLVAWCETYLADYFYRRPSSFHRWLTIELETLHQRRGTRLDVIAPRGSAKSTWSSFAYPLYCAVHGLEPYIQIVSDTTAQAWIWLEAIRKELQDNET